MPPVTLILWSNGAVSRHDADPKSIGFRTTRDGRCDASRVPRRAAAPSAYPVYAAILGDPNERNNQQPKLPPYYRPVVWTRTPGTATDVEQARRLAGLMPHDLLTPRRGVDEPGLVRRLLHAICGWCRWTINVRCADS